LEAHVDRTLRNTIAVLVLTAFTALAIFGTVQLTARLTGVDSVSSASASTLQDTYYDESGSGQYGYAQNGTGQGNSGQTLTCPATGCTASYCHAGR
jgi:hypothetical protein